MAGGAGGAAKSLPAHFKWGSCHVQTRRIRGRFGCIAVLLRPAGPGPSGQTVVIEQLHDVGDLAECYGEYL